MTPRFDTNRWYLFAIGGRELRPLTTTPDRYGYLPVTHRDGHYGIAEADHLTLLPERHTFERRAPKTGDRFAFGTLVMVADHDFDSERWVIVDGEVTSSTYR